MSFLDKLVTETDIEYAYKLLLGREPENKDAITTKLGVSFDQLRESFLNCNEFQNNITHRYNSTYHGDNIIT
ncbi:MAG: hypothetical protein LIQ31_15940, partial [Planctomycetes bacterium]|nr:hypothetical protein [Planctomycetota bacterium]